jgi:2-polyprenyl-3-methyl-5-hydroxy-6-metoxy-1,4-benzoquinol methylase
MTKSQYLLRSLLRIRSAKICPYCKSNRHTQVDSKYILTTLNECAECKLMFRHPIDTVSFNRKFYQEDYEQHDGITTDLPSELELKELLSSNFAGSGKDYSDKIEFLKTLSDKAAPSVVDYGANWGYTSYQLMQAGFKVQSYELSKPRATFGKKIGVNILTDENQLNSGVDIFFNSHVIEHLPDIKNMFELAKKLLTDDGFFVAYCPNGSADLKLKNPELFHNFWGQVHPNCLSAEFFATVFKDVPYLIGSDGRSEISGWDKNSQQILDVSGNELFVIAKIKKQKF